MSGWLIISEYDDRRNRSIQRAIKYANFRHKASVEEVNFSVERGLDKNQVQRMAELTFIKELKRPLHYRKLAKGKIYLATHLAHEASPKWIRGYSITIQQDSWEF